MEEEEDLRRTLGDLLMRAGAVMGDESVVFVSRLPHEAVLIEEQIARLAQVGADLSAVAAAAHVLHRLVGR